MEHGGEAAGQQRGDQQQQGGEHSPAPHLQGYTQMALYCTVLYYSVLHITWMVTVSGVGVARSPSTLQATPHTSPRIRVEVSAPPTAPCGGSSTECFSRYRGGFRN